MSQGLPMDPMRSMRDVKANSTATMANRLIKTTVIIRAEPRFDFVLRHPIVDLLSILNPLSIQIDDVRKRAPAFN